MDITEVLAPVRDLGAFIRQQRESAQISLRQLAKQAGVSNPYLSQVERGLRRPSAEILAQIAHGLHISVESLLTMAGILEEPTATPALPGVAAAIDADPLLTGRQKSSLLDIYLLYARETERAQAAAPPVPIVPGPNAPDPSTEKSAVPSRTPTIATQGDPDVVPH